MKNERSHALFNRKAKENTHHQANEAYGSERIVKEREISDSEKENRM